MKVFNWVHRRFLHGPSCISSLKDNGLEKDVRSRVSVERDALLGHGGHMGLDAFKDWKDGFLTIGTLAIGPLETSKYEIIKEGVDDDDDDRDHHDDENDEENNYLDFNQDTDFKSSPLMKTAKFSHEFEKIDVDEVHNQIIEEEVANKNFFDELKNKRRVTLADLFSEDSDHQLFNKVKEINEDAEKNVIIIAKPNLKIKPTSRAKNGLSKAKKLLKEELLPTKKLNQLMKRMMKRKIHPDVEGKKEIHMTNNNGLDIPTNQQDIDEGNDSESLLLIQDTMV